MTTDDLRDAMAVKGARDYFQQGPQDPAGLLYRLDGRDVIDAVRDALMGGSRYDQEKGEWVYNEENRLMNDEGITRVDFFLRGAVTKITHLTKFESINRILIQMRELGKAFLIELTLNMKRWGPIVTIKKESTQYYNKNVKDEILYIISETEETITFKSKVRNKNLVQQVVENSILTSLQRGEKGFEAENLQKSWLIQESIAKGGEQQESRFGGFRNLLPGFGRQQPPPGGGY